mgnify:FL=1
MDNVTFDYFNVDDIPRECICLFILILIIIGYYLLSSNTSKIPKVIYQTYKDKNVPPIVKERWLQLNPGYEYHLYDDADCYQFLLDYYDKEHADFFKYKIKDGPIKSDFWRVCILYQFGGIYADIDIKPLVPIDEFVNSDTAFYTCLDIGHLSNNYIKNLNPHFIAVTPKNDILLKLINYYMNHIKKISYSYNSYSITGALTHIFEMYNLKIDKEGVYYVDGQIIQISQEICPNGCYNDTSCSECYIEQDSKRIMDNRDGEIYTAVSHEFK